MKAGWKKMNLGDLCQVIGGGTPTKTKQVYYAGNIPWATVRDMRSEVLSQTECKITKEAVKSSATNIISGGNVVIATRVGLGKVCLLGQDTAINQDLRGIVPNDPRILSVRFLFLWLKSVAHLIIAEGTGATVQGVKLPFVKSLQVPLPPLPEQRRIVGILDEAFDSIAIAKANAEKNLQNARALFESHLQSVFTQRGKGWVEKPLETVASILNGFAFKSTDFSPKAGAKCIKITNVGVREFVCESDGYLPTGFATKYETVAVKKGSIVLALTRTIISGGLKVAIVPDEYDGALLNQRVASILTNPNSLTAPFLFAYLSTQTVVDYVKERVNTLMQPNLSIQDLRSMPIPLPPIHEQDRITYMLSGLNEETRRLEAIYQNKLAAFEELKKSLLHQAFSGELTKAAVKAIIIPFPTTISNITPIDLHAGILAMGYQLHEKHGKQNNFGHVKAEKIAHMIEAYVGIDLGRNPIKDAAGPNDFQHLKKVEFRARKAGFFDFQQVEGSAYRVTKYRQFDALIAKTRRALADHAAAVDRLLELMLPMNTQQAEIFCTVYAAWNNLMLDQQSITDEQIVLEARDRWHPEKLKISREKFFSAIEWIREKDLTPVGRGKKVNRRAK